ncbi:MAG: hypothetical protein PHQ85_04070 [Eubacteriales bacterium]|nr:hypothetical protein [Eubacteriales bacterium]MDD4105107.1 hypothetical protein [Eubacteriales bacterium]MDD4710374.1 hypothetical protein [Eubacteriales bacterium]
MIPLCRKYPFMHWITQKVGMHVLQHRLLAMAAHCSRQLYDT